MNGSSTTYTAADLYAFADAMQTRVDDAKAMLLAWLHDGVEERPWSIARLAELRRGADALEPHLVEALELVWRYEAPLLAYEERLDAAGVDFEAFAGRMHRFERRFWRERYRDAQASDPTPVVALAEAPVCKHHRVFAAEIRRLARDGACWDVDAVARATGATTTCGSCRLAVTRILIDELTKAKAAGAVA